MVVNEKEAPQVIAATACHWSVAVFFRVLPLPYRNYLGDTAMCVEREP